MLCDTLEPISLRLLFLLSRFDDLPDAGCKCTTDEGTYDEDPQVGKSGATLEDGRSQRTCGIDGGAGVADADEVNQYEAEADGQTSEVVGGTIGLGGSTEYDEYEDAGEDNLSEQTTEHRDVGLKVVGTRSLHTGNISYEDGEQGTADEGSDALEDDVHDTLLGVHTTSEDAAQRDGGVDVATGDAADGVGHSNDGQAEGQRGSYYCGDVVDGITTEADGNTAAHEYEHHCAHHFC